MKQIHYLAVNRGFYRGEADYLANLPDAVIFTSNIRRATPFNSFNEAEEMFKMLLNYSDSDLNAITGYYTVLVAPLKELPSSIGELVTMAPIICGNCGSSNIVEAAGYYQCKDCDSKKKITTIRYTTSKGNKVEAASILLDADCCSFEQSLHNANCCCSQEAEEEERSYNV